MSWHGFDTETQDGRAILVCTEGEFCTPRNFAEFARWAILRPGSYAAFNMDYDARAVIKMLPKAIWKRLHILNHAEVQIAYLTMFDGARILSPKIKITYYKRKEFALSYGDARFAVYDVWQYYQSGSLENTARKILGKDVGKDALPSEWLSKMEWALTTHREQVIKYCMRDAELALLLMERVRTQFEKLGLNFTRPLSPASMASRYFGPRIRFKLPRWQNNIMRECYNGGRIECYKRGKFEGELYGYDINSAYPWALSQLPDPSGGDLLHVGTCANRGIVYGAYRVRLKIRPDSFPMGPVPWESKRGLIYPVGTFTRWIDRYTLDYLRGYDSVKVKILDAWEFIGHGKEQLFPDLAKLYRERKTRPDINLALKIVLNGLYGKMAQAVPIYGKTQTLTGVDELFYEGSFRSKRDRYASYTHFGIASAVTSIVRNRLHATMMLAPERIIMAATDGLLVQGELPIKCGSELGDWSIKYKSDLAYVVGAGVYACHNPVDDSWDEKVRGLRGARSLRNLLSSKLARTPIEVTVVDSLADGIREKAAQMNVVRKATKIFDVNFDTRRVWPKGFAKASDVLSTTQESEAIILI